jgi:hypothetical protein
MHFKLAAKTPRAPSLLGADASRRAETKNKDFLGGLGG